MCDVMYKSDVDEKLTRGEQSPFNVEVFRYGSKLYATCGYCTDALNIHAEDGSVYCACANSRYYSTFKYHVTSFNLYEGEFKYTDLVGWVSKWTGLEPGEFKVDVTYD